MSIIIIIQDYLASYLALSIYRKGHFSKNLFILIDCVKYHPKFSNTIFEMVK